MYIFQNYYKTIEKLFYLNQLIKSEMSIELEAITIYHGLMVDVM
jgi:hypothetical protein